MSDNSPYKAPDKKLQIDQAHANSSDEGENPMEVMHKYEQEIKK